MLNRSEPVKGNIEVLSADDLMPNEQIHASSKTELANNDIITRGPAKTLVLAKPATQKSDSSIAEVLVNDYVSNGDKQSKKSYDSASSSTGRKCLMVRLYSLSDHVSSRLPRLGRHVDRAIYRHVGQVSTMCWPMRDWHSIETRSHVCRLSTNYRPRGDRNFTDSRQHMFKYYLSS